MYTENLVVYSEEYNIEYFMQDDVCRFCWKRNAVQELSPKTYENCCEPKSLLLDQIRDCLDINLAHDCHPNKVCNTCCDEIKRFHNFKNFCHETDTRLKEILQTNNIGMKSDYKESEFSLKVENHDVGTHIEDDTYEELLETLHHSDSSETEKKQKKVKLKQTYKPKRSATYCNICRLDLKTMEYFTQHNSMSHGIEGNFYKCFGCDKRFKSRKTRIGHEINFCKGLKDGYRCSVCDRCLPKRRMYEAHMRDHRDNVTIELPEKLFKCKRCCVSFTTRDGLKEHVSKHESEKKNYVCESCGRVFTRQDYLHKHKLTHTGTKQHVCPHCGFRSTQRSSLTEAHRRASLQLRHVPTALHLQLEPARAPPPPSWIEEVRVHDMRQKVWLQSESRRARGVDPPPVADSRVPSLWRHLFAETWITATSVSQARGQGRKGLRKDRRRFYLILKLI